MDSKRGGGSGSRFSEWKTKVLRGGGKYYNAKEHPMEYIARLNEAEFQYYDTGGLTDRPEMVQESLLKTRELETAMKSSDSYKTRYSNALKLPNKQDILNELDTETRNNAIKSRYNDSFLMDISAVHTSGVALTQIMGLRYYDQQDNFCVASFPPMDDAAAETVLRNGYHELEKSLETTHQGKHYIQRGGTTACTAIVSGTKIHLASLGDTDAFLCTIDKDGNVKVELLNKQQHVHNSKSEILRLTQSLTQNEKLKKAQELLSSDKLGGSVAVSGAFGDTRYEQDGLTHEPNISSHTAQIPVGGRAFVIIASDGLCEQKAKVKEETKESVATYSSFDEALRIAEKRDTQSINDKQTFLTDELTKMVKSGKSINASSIGETLGKAGFDSGSTDNSTILVKELVSNELQATLMADFDGHGNNKVSTFIADHTESSLLNQLNQLYTPLLEEVRKILLSSDNLKSWETQVKLKLFGGTKVKVNDMTYNISGHIAEIVKKAQSNENAFTILKFIKEQANDAKDKKNITLTSLGDNQTLSNHKYAYHLLATALDQMEASPNLAFITLSETVKSLTQTPKIAGR